MNKPYDLLEQITDETSFLRFLRALREECEEDERGQHSPDARVPPWESFATKDFLRGAEEWAANGDFGAGRHYGDPMLRRVAAMLLAGKYKVREPERPDWD